jgi:hypothetical protein
MHLKNRIKEEVPETSLMLLLGLASAVMFLWRSRKA